VLRALPLQAALYSIRSEWQLMEQLDYNPLPARSARIATGSIDTPDDLRNWPEPPRRQREFARLVRSLQQ